MRRADPVGTSFEKSWTAALSRQWCLITHERKKKKWEQGYGMSNIEIEQTENTTAGHKQCTCDGGKNPVKLAARRLSVPIFAWDITSHV